jgi:hypothetical protein
MTVTPGAAIVWPSASSRNDARGRATARDRAGEVPEQTTRAASDRSDRILAGRHAARRAPERPAARLAADRISGLEPVEPAARRIPVVALHLAVARVAIGTAEA